ncbi:30S ribosome-binding factor RbfA [Marixanthomonas ophiurae]|uniref:Ribosome-binding factor A n=1 Tax=Marixanthomonas ophiurae TaxID=387659 RepID=A0A3E1QAP8_9FLAO|nr:30S ribosome-binding factor RbfA [Marixanthomonas ophiurae]RFN59215.1 30S ribosome-binding factor RbfA [Marixanthomonas ophiurae]
MSTTESNRQKKIAGVLQNDLAKVLQELLRESGQLSTILTVSKVSVTVDLSIAKVYVSVFPSDKAEALIKELKQLTPKIKHQIAQLTKHQLRKMPDLSFYNDDSMEYIQNIEKAVKDKENPIENPDLLPKRKKS